MRLGILTDTFSASNLYAKVMLLERKYSDVYVSAQTAPPNQTQTIKFTNDTDQGHIRVGYGFEWTGPVAIGASAGTLESVLNSLVQLEGLITVTKPDSTTFVVTFNSTAIFEPLQIHCEMYRVSVIPNGYWLTGETVYAHLGIGSTWLGQANMSPSDRLLTLFPLAEMASGDTFTLTFTKLSDGTTEALTLPFSTTASALQTAINALDIVGGSGVLCKGGPLSSNLQMQIDLNSAFYFVSMTSNAAAFSVVKCGRSVQLEKIGNAWAFTGISWNY